MILPRCWKSAWLFQTNFDSRLWRYLHGSVVVLLACACGNHVHIFFDSEAKRRFYLSTIRLAEHRTFPCSCCLSGRNLAVNASPARRRGPALLQVKTVKVRKVTTAKKQTPNISKYFKSIERVGNELGFRHKLPRKRDSLVDEGTMFLAPALLHHLDRRTSASLYQSARGGRTIRTQHVAYFHLRAPTSSHDSAFPQ